jgi:(p)ppGpp synthase/HD superfamily hydrolase
MPRATLAHAKALADRVHDGETDRLGHPYIYHVADVARRSQPHGEEAEIVGWLHDVIESSPADQRFQMSDAIEAQFGTRIHSGVWAMTRLEPPLWPHKEAFHGEYMVRVTQDPLARLVKAGDLAHNISKLWLMGDDPRVPALQDQYAKGLEMLSLDPEAHTHPIQFVDGIGWVSA